MRIQPSALSTTYAPMVLWHSPRVVRLESTSGRVKPAAMGTALLNNCASLARVRSVSAADVRIGPILAIRAAKGNGRVPARAISVQPEKRPVNRNDRMLGRPGWPRNPGHAIVFGTLAGIAVPAPGPGTRRPLSVPGFDDVSCIRTGVRPGAGTGVRRDDDETRSSTMMHAMRGQPA